MVTYAEIDKIKNQVPEGWELDINYYVFHKEKSIKRTIEIGEDKRVIYTLSFRGGNYYSRVKQGYKIMLNRSIQNGNCITGLGHSILIDDNKGELYPRKNFKTLCAVAGTLPTKFEDLESLFLTKDLQLQNGVVDNGHGVVISSSIY